MSSTTMTLEERFDALIKQNEFLTRSIQEDARKEQETQAQHKYLQKQLDAYSKQKQQAREEPPQSDSEEKEQVFSHTLDSSSEDEPLRMTRQDPQFQASSNDFKIEVQEFEGKLDPEDFLDCFTHS